MTMSERCLSCALYLLSCITRPISNWLFRMWYEGDRTRVPAITNDILLLSATALAKKIRNREIRSYDAVSAYIARAKEVNPIINAVVSERFEEALKDAQKVDRVLEGGDLPEDFFVENAPFLGVPFTAKEAMGIVGLTQASGLLKRRGYIAKNDADVIKLLKKAGAIPLAVTNVSELCMWYESSNNLYGRTCNPYNTARIVGGSSGGEAGLLAAGGSVIGVGSDIGGSIRMPAFFNGIFGHKPSAGIISNLGQFPGVEKDSREDEFLTTGPLCRYAEDLLPMVKLMADKNASKLALDEKVDLKSLTFYTMENDGGSLLASSVDPQLVQAQRMVAHHFAKIVGAKVKPVSVRKLRHSLAIWSTMLSVHSKGPTFCDLMGNTQFAVNPYAELLRWFVGRSEHTFPAIALGIAEKWSGNSGKLNAIFTNMCSKLRIEIASLLSNDGVLLYPSHPLTAPYHNQPILLPFNFTYTAIFNVLGLPVTQCPLGLGEENLPMGIQVVANLYNDRLSLAVAREIERAFGGWATP